MSKQIGSTLIPRFVSGEGPVCARPLTARPARVMIIGAKSPEWGKGMDAQGHNPEKPQEILNRLEALYEALSEGSIFDRWFRSSTSTEPEPMFTEFLKSVQELLSELAESLRGADNEERSQVALDAARLMLRVKPVNEKSQAEWYMVAGEYSFSALIPLTPKDTLKSIRDAYVRGTPKRMMYPRQRELLKLMEEAVR